MDTPPPDPIPPNVPPAPAPAPDPDALAAVDGQIATGYYDMGTGGPADRPPVPRTDFLNPLRYPPR